MQLKKKEIWIHIYRKYNIYCAFFCIIRLGKDTFPSQKVANFTNRSMFTHIVTTLFISFLFEFLFYAHRWHFVFVFILLFYWFIHYVWYLCPQVYTSAQSQLQKIYTYKEEQITQPINHMSRPIHSWIVYNQKYTIKPHQINRCQFLKRFDLIINYIYDYIKTSIMFRFF